MSSLDCCIQVKFWFSAEIFPLTQQMEIRMLGPGSTSGLWSSMMRTNQSLGLNCFPSSWAKFTVRNATGLVYCRMPSKASSQTGIKDPPEAPPLLRLFSSFPQGLNSRKTARCPMVPTSTGRRSRGSSLAHHNQLDRPLCGECPCHQLLPHGNAELLSISQAMSSLPYLE